MKEIIIIIVVLGTLLGCNIMVQNHLNETSSNLIAKLEKLQNKVVEYKDSENRDELKEIYVETEEEWVKVHKMWSIIVVHQELDNIEQALVKAKSSIYGGSIEDSIEEIETAKFFINHVKEREKVTIENIF